MLSDVNVHLGDLNSVKAEGVKHESLDKTCGTEMSLKEDARSKWKEEWGPQRAIVAGCIGACNQTIDAYWHQAEGLIDGGADVLLLESIYDLANAEAALKGIRKAIGEKTEKAICNSSRIEDSGSIKADRNVVEEEIPVMVSATIDRQGRILSGEDFRTVFRRLKKYGLFSVGFNCSFGAEAMIPFAAELAEFVSGSSVSGFEHLGQAQVNMEVGEDMLAKECAVSICPSAGLPDSKGLYPERPDFWASCLSRMISEIECCNSKQRDKNECVSSKKRAFIFAGGCCGTTPEYIKALAAISF